MQLAQLSKSAAIQELLAKTVRDSGIAQEIRLLALRAMGAAGLKNAPSAWLSSMASVLAGNARHIDQGIDTGADAPLELDD
jgi:hypothetical protein